MCWIQRQNVLKFIPAATSWIWLFIPTSVNKYSIQKAFQVNEWKYKHLGKKKTELELYL